MFRFAPCLVVSAIWINAALLGQSNAQGMITVSPPQADTEATERPVTYDGAQATSGRKAYDRLCVMCHGANLDDGEFGGPPLVGSRFEEKWGELPVSALYGYIEAAMPPDRPGRISAEVRTAIIAYILARNGYPAGPTLPATAEAQETLLIVK